MAEDGSQNAGAREDALSTPDASAPGSAEAEAGISRALADPARVWHRIGDPKQGFRYTKADGSSLRSPAALNRIQALRIPPAWVDVRISPRPDAKVQAVGTDAAGRKQYLYHAGFVAERQAGKFGKLLSYARALPRLRAMTDEHLKQTGLTRERVLATVVRLMGRGFFRVGSERYATENKTFGIATLKKRHLQIQGDDLHFRYVGKKKVDQRLVVADTPLAEIMAELKRLPGARLFRYVDDAGKVHNVTAAEVNAYIKAIVGERFTSKDIRTWGGTVRAATILAELGPAASPTEAAKNVTLACKLVASELGNTPAVCRSAYIHPGVLERYLSGETMAPVMRSGRRSPEPELEPEPESEPTPTGIYDEEAALIRFMEKARRPRRGKAPGPAGQRSAGHRTSGRGSATRASKE